MSDPFDMFEGQVHDPRIFIQALRQFHDTQPEQRGSAANGIADAIIAKRVDLAAVRQILLDEGKDDLMDTLDRLIELIEPYIIEGGVDE